MDVTAPRPRRPSLGGPLAWLLAFGILAFLVASLSVADMLLPKPWDGVVLESDTPGEVLVRYVLDGTGGARAGLHAGDRIVGIDRTVLTSTAHAARLLTARRVGDRVPYLLRDGKGLREVVVELGPRRIASAAYAFASVLGFTFFLVGLFVLRRRPQLRAAQVFYLLGTLFMLFLVCRLRPASYSWVDSFVLTTGMLAILLLPPAFLHFFLLFPRPVALWPRPDEPASSPRRLRWLVLMSAGYLGPTAVLWLAGQLAKARGRPLHLISGAPVENWWVLAAYMLLGLSALWLNGQRLENPRERQGVTLVLLGAVFGVLPFLVLAVGFPSFLRTERFLFWSVVPLSLVPATFAYAIVRFGLLDIQVLLRRSLLYTLTTAAVTALYALGIGLAQARMGGTSLATSASFPILYAIAIVLLFEPLRRRLQVVVDRFFRAEETSLRRAMVEMGTAFAAEVDLEAVVRELVEKMPRLLGLRFAALYLVREGRLHRSHGPADLPASLSIPASLEEHLAERSGTVLLDELATLQQSSVDVGTLHRSLAACRVEVLGDLATSRRRVGMVLLSEKTGRLGWEQEELELLEGLLHQAAMALETSLLLDERTRQAELERDVEIAANVQSSLLPASLHLGAGWSVAAACRPARHVGGDFYTDLPGPDGSGGAIVYGDVAGKSVSAALLMMAAHEILHTLAMTHRDPEQLFDLANQRLRALGARKSFVAACYLAPTPAGEGISYVLAGQPQPLLRRRSGQVEELSLPEHRIPLGALGVGSYGMLETHMEPGELVLGYSDGVLDARSPSGEAFGFERLVDSVTPEARDAQAMVDRIMARLAEFTRGAEPYDDITLVAVSRLAP